MSYREDDSGIGVLVMFFLILALIFGGIRCEKELEIKLLCRNSGGVWTTSGIECFGRPEQIVEDTDTNNEPENSVVINGKKYKLTPITQ